MLVNWTGTTESSDTPQAEEGAPSESYQFRLSVTETVPIRSLLPADSPRSTGEDVEHIRLLSGLETALPPIIVHRSTMRIVDGMHRLRAMALRGDETIQVHFFEGDERDAFVVAVKENTTHGLPLSAGDRAAAASRIVRSHPHWSDRAIAEVTGISARTVKNIRCVAFFEEPQPTARLGRDGRIRPLDSSAGRIRAAKLIAEGPHISLRQIAQQAGISPGTVRDVRDRLKRGDDPLPSSLRSADAPPIPTPRNRPNASSVSLPGIATKSRPAQKHDRNRTSPLATLIKDPSLRSGEHSRLLLRMLSTSASLLPPSRQQLINSVPEHCVGLVCQAAKENAAAWAEFAEDLERRATRLRARVKG